MPAPDLQNYNDLTLFDLEPTDLVERAVLDAAVKMPDWSPIDGSTEMVLMEALSLVASEVVYAANRLPGGIMLTLQTLYGITRAEGTPPTAAVTFTVADALGHTIPAGTAVRLNLDDDVVDFATDDDLVIPAGFTTGTVDVTGQSLTAVANGTPPGTPLQMVSAVLAVDSVTIAASTTGTAVSTPTSIGSGTTSAEAAITVPVTGVTAGAELFVAVGLYSGPETAAVTFSISDTIGGLTWTKVEKTALDTNATTTAIFRAVAGATAAGNITITPSRTGSASSAIRVNAYQVVNHGGIGATGTGTASVTLSAPPAANSLVLLAAGTGLGSDPGLTAPSGFTALVSDANTSPYLYSEVAYKVGSVLQTNTVGGTSSNPITTVAIELLAPPAASPGVSAGADPETDEDWRNRAIQRFARLNDTLVQPDHFTEEALSFPQVVRATTVNDFDGSTTNAGHVATAVLGSGGALISSGDKTAIQADLAAKALVNLTVHVVDPTITNVNVTTTVHLAAGANGAAVRGAVQAALTAYLSTDTWPWSATVRVNKLIQIIQDVDGVDYATVSAPASDVSLTGAAPLARAGTLSVTTV